VGKNSRNNTMLDIQEYIKFLKTNFPVKSADLSTFLSSIDFVPPSDYIDFMVLYNGAEGKVGKSSYLKIWAIEELIEYNRAYEVDLYAEGYFIFGTNLGGTAYAFNKKDSSIVQFEFIGMLMDDNPIYCGAGFVDFLSYLYNMD
jgi:hypothetical protein